MFRVARQNRVFQDVLEQIETAILNGEVKPGDKLPNERELREVMEISRPTLREALRVLEQKGLIEIRVGVKGGAYVKQVGLDQARASLDMLIQYHRVAVSHLSEFREGVERIVASLATERATTKDLDELQTSISEMESILAEDPPDSVRFYEVESVLHLALARLSGNPIYEWVLSAVATGVHSYIHLLPQDPDRLRMAMNDWRHVVAAMRRREVSRVGNMVAAHVIRFNILNREDFSSDKPSGEEIMLRLDPAC